MKRIMFHLAVAPILCGVLSVATAEAQDFQKTYQIGAGGSISVRNVSGDVKVSGYDGDVVVVKGLKQGRDRDRVEVEDLSSANRVEIRVRYAENCNCDASVEFQVQVPRSIRYNFDQISTASGDIELSAVTGEVRARTASGDVSVRDVSGTINVSTASGDMRVRDVKGSVNARSASGDVDVEMARLEGVDRMEFSSASGDVMVRLPSSLDADVDLSSATGSLQTDFPIEVQRDQYGPRKWARGRVGSGARRLRISSASGDVSLKSF